MFYLFALFKINLPSTSRINLIIYVIILHYLSIIIVKKKKTITQTVTIIQKQKDQNVVNSILVNVKT